MVRIKSITLTKGPERAIRVEISNGNAYILKGDTLTVASCPSGMMGWNDQKFAQMVSNAFRGFLDGREPGTITYHEITQCDTLFRYMDWRGRHYPLNCDKMGHLARCANLFRNF